MKKLSLQVDQLAVESFPTGEAQDRMGTVEGAEMIPTPPYVTCGCLNTKPTNCPCTPVY